jgi:hypothetical protein
VAASFRQPLRIDDNFSNLFANSFKAKPVTRCPLWVNRVGDDWTIQPADVRTTPKADNREMRTMTDEAEKRGQLIRHLEEALALADEIEDGYTGFLIERAR